jgi:protein-disulfide isomerase
MKRFLPFAIILIVALVAVGAGVTLYRANRETVFPPIAGELAAEHPGAKPPHFKGSTKATVVAEEFADLQCPPCAGLSVLLKKFDDEYGGRVRVVFRHFPLQMHKHAAEAARATEAAGLQGRFWEMSEMLFKNQSAWSKATEVTPIFEQYAQSIGLDVAKYKADLAQPEKLQSRIDADVARGDAMKVTATPTLFLNNQRVPQQSMNDAGIRKAIDALLKGEPAFPSASAAPTATPAAAVPVPTASPAQATPPPPPASSP